MRLVVLDDDTATTEFMATVARRRGWEVSTATRPNSFQDLISAAPPDAILLDLQLGASDGIEQLRFLHTRNYRGNIVLMERLRRPRARVRAGDRRLTRPDDRRRGD